MLLTLAAFLIVIGVLIFVHELGHFLVAKAVGVQVLRFSLGFGRPLLQWRRGETEYWVSWIPLGGYVKMAGLEDEGMAGELEGGKSDVPVDPARAFDRKPLWARMAVIVAGVTMNLFLAFGIYSGLNVTEGVQRTAMTPIDSIDAKRLPPGAEALAAVTHGDRIIRLNGDTAATWDDLSDRIVDAPGDVRIEVAGRPEPIVLTLPQGDATARRRVLGALVPLFPARIGLVTPGKPAARAGLRLGDVIVRAGGDSVRSWSEMVRLIRRSAERPLELELVRGDSLVRVTVVPEAEVDTDSAGVRRTRGVIGASQDPRGPTVRIPVSFSAALSEGVDQTIGQAIGVVVMVKRLILRQISAREVGGPILIYQMSGQMVRLGFDWFLGFIAFFSITLAVLNMLPIPVLDGGQAMFLIAEAIRRKPLSLQLRMRLTQVGLLVILGIMALAIANDVIRNIPR